MNETVETNPILRAEQVLPLHIQRFSLFVALCLCLCSVATSQAQNIREWQATNGRTLLASLVSRSEDKKSVNLLDETGKEREIKLGDLSDFDQKYLDMREIIPVDRAQFELVAGHLEGLRSTPESTVEILLEIAKIHRSAPFASVWAGIALAAALNKPDDAIKALNDAKKRIDLQRKIDPSRHRRTLASLHNNLGICYLKKKDADSAAEEFDLALAMLERTPPVVSHNIRYMLELSNKGNAFRLNGNSRSAIVKAVAKLPVEDPKKKLAPGWYYSLDLQPPDGMENELSVFGVDPPDPTLELIASGTGIVCAPGHVLTVKPVVIHPNRTATLATIAVPKSEKVQSNKSKSELRFQLKPAKEVIATFQQRVPVKQIVSGRSKTTTYTFKAPKPGETSSELAMLVVENLDLPTLPFVDVPEAAAETLSILGFKRGPDILKEGVVRETGRFASFTNGKNIFKTSVTLHGGSRGGGCFDSKWNTTGVAWKGADGADSSKGLCFSTNAIRTWKNDYVKTVELGARAQSPSEETSFKGTVPILVWGRSSDIQNKLYSEFYNEDNLIDLFVVRDEWCFGCRGTGGLPCKTCDGKGQVQDGFQRKQVGVNPKNGQPIFIQVPSYAACPGCKGAKKQDCPLCVRGKLPAAKKGKQ